MSRGFKVTLSTISIVVTLAVAAILYMGLTWVTGSLIYYCSDLRCLWEQLIVFSSLPALLFYFGFLQTDKDLYFYLSLVPLLLILIGSLLVSQGFVQL